MAKVPTFDNLDDFGIKFCNTICYLGPNAVYIKQVSQKLDPITQEPIPNKFQMFVSSINGRNKSIDFEDPEFNYRNYNIGYVNMQGTAAWWFRKPIKQYRQGLRKEQLGYIFSDPDEMLSENFGWSKPFVNMLENKYPKIEYVGESLKTGSTKYMAFHKDFALSWDSLHEDYILEYRGTKVGTTINNTLSEYKLLSNYKHISEALQEALA